MIHTQQRQERKKTICSWGQSTRSSRPDGAEAHIKPTTTVYLYSGTFSKPRPMCIAWLGRFGVEQLIPPNIQHVLWRCEWENYEPQRYIWLRYSATRLPNSLQCNNVYFHWRRARMVTTSISIVFPSSTIVLSTIAQSVVEYKIW